VLALGPNAPWRPAWATGCEHVYDPDFDGLEAADARTVVVGGGITGAQLALRLQSLGRSVCWVTRDLPRVADFDSDPCYAGPRCLAPFQRTPIAQRTALLEAARRPGTLPPDIHARMAAALAAGEIGWQRGDVVARDAGGLQFADGRHLAADRVILATGFQPQPASNSLLAGCIHDYELRCDRHGHVFINDVLEAVPGLHLLGNPASLQLGPMAGNIQGARLAGRRLAPVAAHGVTTHHRSQPQA
jgi:NADH dehydrogenase FAD-containing subunit